MKIIKTLLRYGLFALLAILVAMALIPYVFKSEIVEGIREASNEHVNAHVDFSDIDVSLFRDFPNVSVRILDLKIDGMDQWAGTTLLQADYIDLGFYLPSLWAADGIYQINNIEINTPTLDVVVDADGRANYDIIPPSEDTTAISYHISLSQYQVTDAHISYIDNTAGMTLLIDDLDHRGGGDMTATVFDLATETRLGAVSLTQGGVAYLRKASLALDADINIDLQSGTYTLQDHQLKLNNLVLNADATIKQLSDGYDIKAKMSAPQTDFKDVYSLIPYAYTKDYDSVKSSGTGQFEATVDGVYKSAPATYPAFEVALKLADGYIQYPDLPADLKDIQVDVLVSNTTTNLSDLSINLRRLHLDLGGQIVDGKAMIRQPLGNTSIDGYIKGNVDLAKVQQAMPMEGVTRLAGLMDIDITAAATKDDLATGNAAAARISGTAAARGLVVNLQDQPPVEITAATATFSTDRVDVDLGPTTLGSSDLQGTIAISNLSQYMAKKAPLHAEAELRSDKFDANEWLPTPEVTNTAATTATATPLDLSTYTADILYTAATLKYDTYLLTDVTASGKLADDALQVTQASAKTANSDISISGNVRNLSPYLNETGPLLGDVVISGQQVVLDDFMTTTNTTDEEVAGVVPVPADMDLNVGFDIKKLVYDKIDLSNVDGTLSVSDQVAEITRATADGLGGRMSLQGMYSTITGQAPAFTMKYDLSKINFAKTFEAVTTAQMFAPVMQYIDGFFNSTLVMDGTLTKDMMPDLNTINASGFIETLDSKIKGFEPLNKVANKLSLDNLKTLALENTKNWVEITNGTLELKPQDIKYQGIDMVLSGSHRLDTDMDYTLLMHVPRALLAQTGVGAAADTGLRYLEQQAGQLGLNLSAGDYLDLAASIGGTITKPTLSIKPVGASDKTNIKDALKDAAKAKADEGIAQVKDSVKTAVKKAEQQVRDTIDRAVNKAKDSITTVINKEVDKAKEKATEKAKEVIKETAGKVVTDSTQAELEKKAEEILGEKGKEEVDKIKDKLKDFNPFGKKKKKDE